MFPAPCRGSRRPARRTTARRAAPGARRVRRREPCAAAAHRRRRAPPPSRAAYAVRAPRARAHRATAVARGRGKFETRDLKWGSTLLINSILRIR